MEPISLNDFISEYRIDVLERYPGYRSTFEFRAHREWETFSRHHVYSCSDAEWTTPTLPERSSIILIGSFFDDEFAVTRVVNATAKSVRFVDIARSLRTMCDSKRLYKQDPHNEVMFCWFDSAESNASIVVARV